MVGHDRSVQITLDQTGSCNKCIWENFAFWHILLRISVKFSGGASGCVKKSKNHATIQEGNSSINGIKIPKDSVGFLEVLMASMVTGSTISTLARHPEYSILVKSVRIPQNPSESHRISKHLCKFNCAFFLISWDLKGLSETLRTAARFSLDGA